MELMEIIKETNFTLCNSHLFHGKLGVGVHAMYGLNISFPRKHCNSEGHIMVAEP